MRFYLESLGCPKNLVDSQGIARVLEGLGHESASDPRHAEVLIVNTCGFIEDARQESLSELLKLARHKRPGQSLVAAGCLSQYWGRALLERIPAVDALLGTQRWGEIGLLVHELAVRRERRSRDPLTMLGEPRLASVGNEPCFARQGASAYLKIADGCSAPCAFCAIPLIKGQALSRPMHAIIADAVALVRQGAKEIVLIAQDTTAYGRDRGERDGLPALIGAILDAAPDLHWLRLMYAYPGHVSSRLIDLMATEQRICHYLDLPLQHAHPAVLRRMKRPADVDRTLRLIAELRGAMPDLALRSTFIVGYPGETEAEFQALADFCSEVRFDRLGVFSYSPEEATAAASLPDPVPEEVKAERHDRLMRLQQRISLEINQRQVGRTLEVLVEGQGEGMNIGRSYRDAPEIDGLVFFFPGDVATGEIVPVRVTGAMEYDLIGQVSREG